MGTSSCVPMGARIARSVSPEEEGQAGDECMETVLEVVNVKKKNVYKEWVSQTITFESSTEVFMFYICHSMNVLRVQFQQQSCFPLLKHLNNTPLHTGSSHD